MHVLMTTDTVGGVWTYTRELASGLIRRGHRITLVSFGQGDPAQAPWMRDLSPHLNYHPTAFPLEWMQDAQAGIAQSVPYLENLISEICPDVLHLNQYCYGALNCSVPRLVVAHSDVISWWKAVHGGSPPPSPWIRWYRDVVGRGLRSADAVVAPSRWMLEGVRELYGHPQRDQVIYNGRSSCLFEPTHPKSNCVVSVGRLWDQGKQIALLLARPHPIPVRIAGSAEHPEGCLPDGQSPIAESPGVELMGVRSEAELCALFTSSSIYAATSRYEPFGLAPLEAAFSGCALLLNDIPSFREIWDDAAVYFRRNDADSLAEAIRALAEDPTLRECYGRRASERARAHFDAPGMVRQYEALYGVLAGRQAAA